MSLLITLIYKLSEIYTTILVIYALLSWFPGAYQSGFGKLIIKLVEPYLRLFRRFRLSIGPIDFTIVVALIFLQIVVYVVVNILARLAGFM
ncbi:YggT family protein [Enterococcus hirae]|nr:YggT family protein [Enterococcaceae bacterium]MCI1919107.1 YggT family protein [Enterococcaceae bacterium]MDM8213517.1 YggT family protein [Enterococcus hirae]